MKAKVRNWNRVPNLIIFSLWDWRRSPQMRMYDKVNDWIVCWEAALWFINGLLLLLTIRLEDKGGSALTPPTTLARTFLCNPLTGHSSGVCQIFSFLPSFCKIALKLFLHPLTDVQILLVCVKHFLSSPLFARLPWNFFHTLCCLCYFNASKAPTKQG